MTTERPPLTSGECAALERVRQALDPLGRGSRLLVLAEVLEQSNPLLQHVARVVRLQARAEATGVRRLVDGIRQVFRP